MNKEFYKTQTSIGAALAIIGFILPWVSMGPFGSISGWDIPKVAEMFSGMARSFSRDEVSSGTQLYYLLYLIPILSGYLLYGEYKDSKKFFVPAKIVIFLLSAFVVYKLSDIGKGGIFERAGVGLWITVVGSIYLLIQAIKELQTAKTVTIVENEAQTAESGTPNKKMFDLAAKQAQAKKALKLSPKTKKIIIASTAIIILSVGLYFLLHKNSYQKVMSALENNNWQEVNYNYEKAQAEISSGDLKLDYDETKKLGIAQWIADKMIPIDEFRKKYYSSNRNLLQTFYDLDKEWTALPNLKTKPSDASAVDIDVDKIYKPYVLFSDSFNLAFVELYFPDSSMQKLRDKKVQLDQNYLSTTLPNLSSNTDIILSRIIDSENNDVKIRIEKVKNKLSEAKSLATTIIAEQVKNTPTTYTESNDEPSFTADFIGTWTGKLGDKDFQIVLISAQGDNIEGYNVVGDNKRAIKGTVTADDDVYTFTLSEPGDDKWDGVFTLKMNNDNNFNAIGQWKANNGKSSKDVNIKKQ